MENIHTGQRLMGYQRAMFENGLLFDPNLIYYGDWTRESGYKGAKELLKQNITALFSLSDRMTGGVYDYLYEKGLSIGKDISVASFDNESISSFFRPQLTTMELPLREIGRISAEQLLNKINHTEDNVDDKVETDVIKVPCELILRDSVYVR